jgi:hypothetical protein
MSNINQLIEINKNKGLPRKYTFNQFIRLFTLTFAILALVYSGWLIFAKISSDSSNFQKFVPFAILFLAMNTIMKNLFTLNQIVFRQEKITFRYLGKRSFTLFWQDLYKMEYSDDKRKLIRLKYRLEETEKIFDFPMAFPKMLEIINSIAELCPHLEFDEFIGNVVITPKEKDQYNKRQAKEQASEDENQE